MSTKRKLAALAIVLLAATAGTAFGQMIATGKLTGTVTEANNAPLPGVTVTITSPSLILPQMAAVTNEKGLYKFFNLPSGRFKVVFEIQGFKTLVREGIIINAETTTTLDVNLEQGTLTETVTVVVVSALMMMPSRTRVLNPWISKTTLNRPDGRLKNL